MIARTTLRWEQGSRKLTSLPFEPLRARSLRLTLNSRPAVPFDQAKVRKSPSLSLSCSFLGADLTVRCMSVRAPHIFLARSLQSAELVKCVRTIVQNELGHCSAAHIASRLGVGLRSLERHLSSEGTTYQEISREMQLQASQQLLASGASVSDVAKTLGFSEISAFTRAFRRWSGETPSSWKLRHLEHS